MTKQRIENIRKSAGQRIDKFLNNWISRKLMVLIIASVGLFDGKLDGDDLPDGVYYYFIKDGSTLKFKGSITLTK